MYVAFSAGDSSVAGICIVSNCMFGFVQIVSKLISLFKSIPLNVILDAVFISGTTMSVLVLIESKLILVLPDMSLNTMLLDASSNLMLMSFRFMTLLTCRLFTSRDGMFIGGAFRKMAERVCSSMFPYCLQKSL